MATEEAATKVLLARQRWWRAGGLVRDKARAEAAAAAAASRVEYQVTPRQTATRLIAKLGRDGATDAARVQAELSRVAARRNGATEVARTWGSPSAVSDKRGEIARVEQELEAAGRAVEACLAGLADPSAVKNRIEEWATTLVQCEDEYAAAMAEGNVPRAAHVAANTPQRYLQTDRTWDTFRKLGSTALFEYACALVDAGEASAGSGVECAIVAVDADRLDVLETWILGAAIAPTIELARALHNKCGEAPGERRFVTLASLAVAACERVPPPRTGRADAEAAAAYAEAGMLGAELLVRRGRVRAALAFGAARGASVAVCTAMAIRVGSIQLAVALGRAAARNIDNLDGVARLLPPTSSDSATVWQQWNSANNGSRNEVAREALATAFAEELVGLCVDDLNT